MDANESVNKATRGDLETTGGTAVQKDSPQAAPGVISAGYDASYGQYIDHTVLKPETVKATLKKFCDEAKQYHFASVCVNPVNVPYVASQLKGSGVKTCSVVGFPLGASTSFIKAAESIEAIKNGAGEIDMVMNIGALKDKEYDVVYNDILAVVNASHPYAVVKVIIETSALTDDEKVTACSLAKKAGVDFVKTSTGFGSGGATVEDVRLMKQTVGEEIQVKASTGINDRSICDEMLKAGAIRMGTSKGIRIVKGEVDPPPGK
jgi:deoxyribose-phosphate aldolase